MDKIRITDLEVFYQVGITEQERAKPQRLLLSIEMEHDFTSVSKTGWKPLLLHHFVSVPPVTLANGPRAPRHAPPVESQISSPPPKCFAA